MASIFPHSEALHEETRLVAAPWVAKLDSCHITLTLPVLNNAACIIFLIQGNDKATALRRVLTGESHPDPLPAQAIRPGAGELLWLIDQTAATRLDGIAAE